MMMNMAHTRGSGNWTRVAIDELRLGDDVTHTQAVINGECQR